MKGHSFRFLSRCNVRREASVRLICFPHAGGSASIYAAWQRLLSPAIEIVGVQLPGREERRGEPFLESVPLAVESVIGELAELDDRPLAFFGYSLGAVLAFECIRARRRRGAPAPRQLFVAASRSPQRLGPSAIAHLPTADFVSAITRGYEGIPRQVLDQPELLAYFVTVLRGDLRLLEAYRYLDEPPLRCPIQALGGSEDRHVESDDLNAWASQTEAEFSSTFLSGGHFFIQRHLHTVLRSVTRTLLPESDG
jgi:medium-chain acyl-[acyl-carrier-protein] hydrolase